MSLPIPDYDQLPEGSIESRIRTLDVDGVEQLLSHEREHANRPQVVLVLEQRAEALRSGAEPTGGSPQGGTPETGSTAHGGPARPQTQGPPVNPPSQGDPTNPAQPRG